MNIVKYMMQWMVGMSVSMWAFGCSVANAPEEPVARTTTDGAGTGGSSSGTGGTGGVGGCEGPLTTLDDCGACGVACAPEHVMGASCTTGSCDYGSCATGFQDCDGDTSNGCESEAAIDVAHCGACNNKCEPLNASSAACELGKCAYEACENGFDDCDADASNGCEAEPAVDVNHCGACGILCDGAVIQNVENPTCSDSKCGYDSCAPFFGDCDQNAANGCEVNMAIDVTHCGTCSKLCVAGENSTVQCTRSNCEHTCDKNFGNCNNKPADGCEVDLQTEENHCGSCGKACAASEFCVAGQCVSTPTGCMPTTDPNRVICISNNKVSTYNTASHCAACTEKGLTDAWSDASCNQLFTNKIVEQLYLQRTAKPCTAQPLQSGAACGYGELMTPDYQPAGQCPTPQDCGASSNWLNCQGGVGNYDAYIYGCCKI